jgi:perosamine synthetase
MIDSKLTLSIANAIKEVIGNGPIGLHEPFFAGNESKYLQECLDSTFVSSVGKFVDQFEVNIANFTNSKFAIVVVNGTAALEISLKLAGVTTGDEVLIPALTFVATATAVKQCNAVPHFVDSEEQTLGIDVSKLRDYLRKISENRSGICTNKLSGRPIRALVPMHTFGHPSDIEGLLDIADEFNLTLVEDAAESFGSTYKGQHTGTFGLLGTVSFNGNKTITTGGGGAILTDNQEIAQKAKHITTTAKITHPWEFKHDQVGFNYRMPNINAALGCAQLEAIDVKLSIKRDLYKSYEIAFSKLEGVKLFQEPENCRSNYWLQTIILDKSAAQERDSILAKLNSIGYMSRPAWNLISTLKPYIDDPKMDLTCAQELQGRIINIPSNVNSK